MADRPYVPVKAPHGTELSCKSWLTEAPLRMLMNNLDPEVAEGWPRSRGTSPSPALPFRCPRRR